MFPLFVSCTSKTLLVGIYDEICTITVADDFDTCSFPVFRKKHVSAILNIRGMTRQAERQEILNIVKDIESGESGGGGLARLSRDRALFSEVPVTSEVHCLNVGLSRVALTASSCFTAMRPRPRKAQTPVQENPDDVL